MCGFKLETEFCERFVEGLHAAWGIGVAEVVDEVKKGREGVCKGRARRREGVRRPQYQAEQSGPKRACQEVSRADQGEGDAVFCASHSDHIADQDRDTGDGDGLGESTSHRGREAYDEGHNDRERKRRSCEDADQDGERSADHDGEDVGSADSIRTSVVDHDGLETAKRKPTCGLAEDVAEEQSSANSETRTQATLPLQSCDEGLEPTKLEENHQCRV